MSNSNKNLVSEFKQSSPVAKKMQSMNQENPIIDNIEKPLEELKINYSDCYTYHQNNIKQALSLLNNLTIKGSDNCKTLATVFDILDKTAIPMDKINLDK